MFPLQNLARKELIDIKSTVPVHDEAMTWRCFFLLLPVTAKVIHQSLMDSHHKGQEMRSLGIFFVVSLKNT